MYVKILLNKYITSIKQFKVIKLYHIEPVMSINPWLVPDHDNLPLRGLLYIGYILDTASIYKEEKYMRSLKRKPFRVLLAGLFCTALAAALPIMASADAGGDCGNGVKWEYIEDASTLRIYGTGVMDDYDSKSNPYFTYLDDVKTVVIDDGVTKIGNQAFYDHESNRSIQSVTMADSVTSIGTDAFKNCKSLQSIAFSDELVTIGNGAFENDGNLTEVDLPDSVQSIGDNAFSYCGRIESVHFPAELKTIGNCAFSSCVALLAADLSGTKLTTIGDHAFEYCGEMKTLILPATLTGIASGQDDYDGDAFWGCDSLAEIYCYADPKNLTWKDLGCNDFSGEASSHTTICYVPSEHYSKYNEYSQGNGKFSKVNVAFAPIDLGAHLYGHSISLDGEIGVNFYMELSEPLKASTTAYMEFTVPGETETQKVYVKDVLENSETIGDKTYYKFKCRVTAKDVASTITAQMDIDGVKGEEYEFSIKVYAECLLAAPGDYFPEAKIEKGVALVKSLLNYGAAAQTYFKVPGTAANDTEYMTDAERSAPDSITAADINKSSYIDTEAVPFVGATLSLRSETTLSLYFDKTLGEETDFTCVGRRVDRETTDKYVIARIRGISAKELGSDFILTFNGGSVTYNPMSYCFDVLTLSNKAELKNVCKALYCYWQAAQAYFPGGNN